MSKLTLTKNQLIILFIFLLLVTSLSIIYSFLKPQYSIFFYDTKLLFRANIKEARKIPISPQEKEFRRLFLNPTLEKISIVFVNSQENSYVAVEMFEIAYKLRYGFLKIGRDIKIDSYNVSSYQGLKGSENHILVAIIPPIFSEKTEVKLEDYVVYIQGKSFKELDLATIKFILTVLGI